MDQNSVPFWAWHKHCHKYIWEKACTSLKWAWRPQQTIKPSKGLNVCGYPGVGSPKRVCWSFGLRSDGLIVVIETIELNTGWSNVSMNSLLQIRAPFVSRCDSRLAIAQRSDLCFVLIVNCQVTWSSESRAISLRCVWRFDLFAGRRRPFWFGFGLFLEITHTALRNGPWFRVSRFSSNTWCTTESSVWVSPAPDQTAMLTRCVSK